MHRALAPSYCHQSHPSDQIVLLIQASAGPLVPSEHSGTQFTTCRAGPHPAAKVPTTPLNASHCTQPCCFLAFSKRDILLRASEPLCILFLLPGVHSLLSPPRKLLCILQHPAQVSCPQWSVLSLLRDRYRYDNTVTSTYLHLYWVLASPSTIREVPE